jgi:hypothetical protein
MTTSPDNAETVLHLIAEYRAIGCRWSIIAWRLEMPERDVRALVKEAGDEFGRRVEWFRRDRQIERDAQELRRLRKDRNDALTRTQERVAAENLSRFALAVRREEFYGHRNHVIRRAREAREALQQQTATRKKAERSAGHSATRKQAELREKNTWPFSSDVMDSAGRPLTRARKASLALSPAKPGAREKPTAPREATRDVQPAITSPRGSGERSVALRDRVRDNHATSSPDAIDSAERPLTPTLDDQPPSLLWFLVRFVVSAFLGVRGVWLPRVRAVAVTVVREHHHAARMPSAHSNRIARRRDRNALAQPPP